MKLGVVDQSPVASGSTPAQALANTIDLARRCDQWGYSRYWLAEHHATEMLAGPAPEVLMARVAAETERIRVGSGGVMLPHYSPFKVAESFQLLETLHPGRIDLGIGRAPGGTPLVTHALQRYRGEGQSPDDFAAQLVELLAWVGDGFPPSHPYARIPLTPSTPEPPEVWLLGSSPWSAVAASQLGLPYCFAAFINPEPARVCVKTYHERFDPTAGGGSQPRTMLAVGAIVADTDEEAARLQMSVRAMRHRIIHGGRGPIPTPDEAIAELGQQPRPIEPWTSSDWPRYLTGRPGPVVEQLERLANESGAEEILVVTIAHDHEARCRSYELLAREAFG